MIIFIPPQIIHLLSKTCPFAEELRSKLRGDIRRIKSGKDHQCPLTYEHCFRSRWLRTLAALSPLQSGASIRVASRP